MTRQEANVLIQSMLACHANAEYWARGGWKIHDQQIKDNRAEVVRIWDILLSHFPQE